MGRCQWAMKTRVTGVAVCTLVVVCLAAGSMTACVPRPIYHSDGSVPAPTRDPRPRRQAARSKPPTVSRPTQTAHPVDPQNISTANAYQIGVASYYGEPFHGRKTANGEVFNMYKLTAAHRVLPLGTITKVTNLSNGRWVVVKVNDRGPFIEGRILDLSFAAALELEMVQAGTSKVMIEIVEAVD
ncbi:MAG: septal ring lytic transglycosylase RlpA family protein [Gemmatimonadetes bacterium]|nr:septal ring lytic transglycosylase RlpA family protein [Gemmatimonadota bacterium]MBT6145311.1 septal ring lytic transglycosylase RlpA family protein [Gemmatimonadota bacterium]MBT7861514.1 septal ring lytic transglycosylase RlpA family protein [Gemmatimonadota bacterium]